MTQLAALNVKITGDSADLQSDLAKAKTQLAGFEASTGSATKRTAGFTGSLGKLTNVSGRTRAQIQNTSFQLQDIAVQLQGGTRASTVFAQQLPQLLGGFNAVGAVLGVLAGVGIPALAFAFAAAGDQVKTFDDALSDIQDTIDSMKAPMEILNMSTDELIEKYGEATERVLQFAVAQAQLAASQAERRLQEEINLLDDVASKYTAAQDAGRDYRNTIQRIGEDFGIAADEARIFEGLLEQVGSASTFEEQQAALQKVLTFLEDNNVELAKIPPELQRAISEMITLSNETDRARELMNKLSASSQGVTVGVPLYEQGFGDEGLLPPPRDEGDDPTRPGRAKTDPLKGELGRVQQSLEGFGMSQEELEIASNKRRQEILEQALEKRYLTQQEYDELAEDEAARHSQAMEKIDRERQQAALQGFSGMFGNLASLMQSSNDRLFKIGKAAAIADAVVNGFSAAVAAWDKGMKIGGPPVAAAFAGASLAKTGGLIASIKSASSGAAGGGATGGATVGAVGTTGGTAEAAAPATVSRNVAINLTGGDMFSRDQVINLINSINEAVEDGAVVRLV